MVSHVEQLTNVDIGVFVLFRNCWKWPEVYVYTVHVKANIPSYKPAMNTDEHVCIHILYRYLFFDKLIIDTTVPAING